MHESADRNYERGDVLGEIFLLSVLGLILFFFLWLDKRVKILFCLRSPDKTKALQDLLRIGHVSGKYVSRLIEQGADVNGVKFPLSKDGKDEAARNVPVLFEAVCSGQSVDVLKILIRAGAAVDMPEGVTPLPVWCLIWRQREAFDFLISSGADMNVRLDDGSTLLHVAAATNNLSVAEDLIVRHGFYVNETNKDGVTPLMAAEQSGNGRLAQRLKELGADAALRDKSGKTAQDYKRRGILSGMFRPAAHRDVPVIKAK